MVRLLVTGLLIVALLAGASIGYFNAQPVRVDYLAGEVELPLVALLILTFLLAALLTGIVVSARLLRVQAELRRTRRQLSDANTELRTLRNLPLTADPARR